MRFDMAEESKRRPPAPPRGRKHPCAAPYGFETSFLNAMAGPLRRWRSVPDPAVERIMARDA